MVCGLRPGGRLGARAPGFRPTVRAPGFRPYVLGGGSCARVSVGVLCVSHVPGTDPKP